MSSQLSELDREIGPLYRRFKSLSRSAQKVFPEVLNDQETIWNFLFPDSNIRSVTRHRTPVFLPGDPLSREYSVLFNTKRWERLVLSCSGFKQIEVFERLKIGLEPAGFYGNISAKTDDEIDLKDLPFSICQGILRRIHRGYILDPLIVEVVPKTSVVIPNHITILQLSNTPHDALKRSFRV